MLLAALLGSAASASTWVRIYDTAGGEAAWTLSPDAGGRVILAGRNSALTANGNPWILKIDEAGDVVGDVAFGTDWIWPADVSRAANGDYLVAGTERAIGAPLTAADVLVARLDPQLRLIWQMAIGGGARDVAFAVAPLPGDGVAAAAITQSFGVGDFDAWVVALDAAGSAAWQVAISTPADDFVRDLCALSDGELVLAAVSGSDSWCVRLDASGRVIWQKQYAGLQLSSLREETPGLLIGAGTSAAGRFAIRLNAATGDLVWQAGFATNDSYGGRGAAVGLPGGGAILVGTVAVGSADRAWVARVDDAGSAVWQRAYGQTNADRALDVAATRDGFVCLVEELVTLDETRLLHFDADGANDTGCNGVRDVSVPPATASFATSWASLGVRRTSVLPAPLAVPVGRAFSVPGVPGGDTFEPDDGCAPRDVLRPGETQFRDFCDGSVDRVLVAGEAGSLFTFSTSGLGASTDTVLELLDGSCTAALASDDNGGGGLASRLSWTAPDDLTRVLQVRQANGASGAGLEYSLTMAGPAPSIGSWIRVFDAFQATAVEQAADGGALGCVADVLTRLDGSGGVRWASAVAPASQIRALPDGSWLAAGQLGSRQWLGRLDDAGSLVWQVELDGGGPQALTDMHLTRDGGVVVAGYAGASSNVAKFDLNGSLAWQHAWRSPSSRTAFALCELSDGTLLVLREQPGQLGVLVKLSAAGDVLWSESLDAGLAIGSTPRALVPMPGAGAVVLGNFGSSWSAPTEGSWAAAVDASGVPTWGLEYHGASYCHLLSARPSASGGVLACGNGDSGSLHHLGGLVLSLRPDGSIEWQVGIAVGYANDVFFNAAPTTDGGALVAGRTNAYAAWVARLPPGGMLDASCQNAEAAQVTTQALVVTTTPLALTPDTDLTLRPGTAVTRPAYLYPHDVCDVLAALPREVSPTGSNEPLLFRGHADLTWENAAASGSSEFNVYRGDATGLRVGDTGACLLSRLATPAASDVAEPAPGNAWFYVVTGRNASGEGPMGFDSMGRLRANSSPCP